MTRFLSILGLFILVSGLPACRLECWGEGDAIFDNVKLFPDTVQTVAGGNPIAVRSDGKFHCAGGYPVFKWSLEPALGTIEITSNPYVVMYRPPLNIDVTTDVKIVVRFHGYPQNTKSDVTIRVLKP
jgi:hypothetical protein